MVYSTCDEVEVGIVSSRVRVVTIMIELLDITQESNIERRVYHMEGDRQGSEDRRRKRRDPKERILMPIGVTNSLPPMPRDGRPGET